MQVLVGMKRDDVCEAFSVAPGRRPGLWSPLLFVSGQKVLDKFIARYFCNRKAIVIMTLIV